MRIVLISALLALVTASASAQTAPPETEAKISEAASRMSVFLDGELADYPSARFRAVKGNYVIAPSGKEVITFCGELNAKNQMGGYGGWNRFALSAATKPGDLSILMTMGGMRGPLASLAPSVIQNSCDKPGLTWSGTDFTPQFQPKPAN